MGQKPPPEFVLQVALTMGAVFSSAVAIGWYEFFWGDGDDERAGFVSAVGVFAIPLTIGAGLSYRGDRRGRPWLRFGSILFLFKPTWFLVLWNLWDDPEFRHYRPRLPPQNDRSAGSAPSDRNVS